jgi:peptide deformylase
VTLPRSDQGWISGIAGNGLVTIGDPRLKAPTAAVEDVADIRDLLETMTQRLRSMNGAGLAAPQIGAQVKAVVVEVRRTDVFPDRPECPLTCMVNPVVLERGDEEVLGWEGCFSVPGLMGLVPRADSVVASYLDQDGRRIEQSFEGYIARVVQHEIDHLDGIEFVDRMRDMTSLTTVQNYLDHHRNTPVSQR